MRKMMLLATFVALAALMMAAAPAFADDNSRHDHFRPDGSVVFVGDDDFCDFFDCFNRFDNDRFCDSFDCFDRNDFCDDGFFFNGSFCQANEQEVESGNATQNINIVGGGANSNQLVGVQGVVNTGNATNNTGVIQTGRTFDGNNDFCDFFNCNRNNDRFCDFFDCFNRFDNGFGGNEVEVEDVGNFVISPTQTVTGTQQVNQAAVAVGGTKWWWK